VTFVLDTQLLLWAAGEPKRLSARARKLLADPSHDLLFSVASLWEIVIKRSLGRPDFVVDPHVLRRGLTDNGYRELPITGAHALAVETLPPLHRDPFDRMLVAQATVEGVVLLTHDQQLAAYPGPVQLV
jgi:PIN domain nuclease of toxin-antitoxin system